MLTVKKKKYIGMVENDKVADHEWLFYISALVLFFFYLSRIVIRLSKK